MTTRQQHHAFGADETIVTAARIIGQAGAESFEISYGPADGSDRQVDHTVEPVRWTATACFPNTMLGTVRAHWTTQPGECQATGASMAVAELLRVLGANVTVIGDVRR